MDKEDFQEYLKDRYEKQIDWYNKHSTLNRKMYGLLQ